MGNTFRRVTATGGDSSQVEGESHDLVLLALDLPSAFQKELFYWQMRGKAMQSLAALHNMHLKL